MTESTIPTTTKQDEKAPATREESRTIAPPVDIFEVEGGLGVVVDLPGVTKDNTDVRVEKDMLTIKAAIQSDLPGEPVYREYDLVNYFRQFQLADEIDQEKISAEMKHGVLTLHLPRAEASRPKKIEVKIK